MRCNNVVVWVDHRTRGDVENGPWVFVDVGVRVRASVRASGFVVRSRVVTSQKEAIRAIAVWRLDSQSCDRVVQREGQESGVTGRLR